MLLALTRCSTPRMTRARCFNQPPVGLGEIERLLDLLLGVARPVCHTLTEYNSPLPNVNGLRERTAAAIAGVGGHLYRPACLLEFP